MNQSLEQTFDIMFHDEKLNFKVSTENVPRVENAYVYNVFIESIPPDSQFVHVNSDDSNSLKNNFAETFKASLIIVYSKQSMYLFMKN